VFRVICEDTIEEEMLRCAEKKLKLEQDICLQQGGSIKKEVSKTVVK